jgi:hypothetical protein
MYEAALDLEIIQQDNKAAKPVTVAAIGEACPTSCEHQDDEIDHNQTAGVISI